MLCNNCGKNLEDSADSLCPDCKVTSEDVSPDSAVSPDSTVSLDLSASEDSEGISDLKDPAALSEPPESTDSSGFSSSSASAGTYAAPAPPSEPGDGGRSPFSAFRIPIALIAVALVAIISVVVWQAQGGGEADYEQATPPEVAAPESEGHAGANEQERQDDDELTPVLAWVNGVPLRESDIASGILQARNQYLMMHQFLFPDAEEIDFDLEMTEGVTFAQVIREEAVMQAAFTVVYTQFAEELGIVVTEDQVDAINDEIDMFISELGMPQFEQFMQSIGVTTRRQVESMFMSYQIFDNLIIHLLENPQAFAQFERFLEPEVEAGDEDIDIFALADELLERIAAGESFDELILTYGEDPGMFANPEGYTFTANQMVFEFENATRALEIGEVSGIVLTTFGIHIIQRVEPDPDVLFSGDPITEDMEVLAAKHILLSFQGDPPPDPQQRMVEAIITGLEEMLSEADVEFTDDLWELPIEL